LAKTDSKQIKALNALLKTTRSAWDEEEPFALEPISQLVVSFLSWNASVELAESAYDKIMSKVVDINEMRVSLGADVVGMIGTRYPQAEMRVMRMLESLFEVYAREHDYKMHSVKEKGKRDQREYLDTLPGIPSYVAAQVALLCFGAHAMPVDDKLAALLVAKGVAEEGDTPAQIESWLLRQIKAGDTLEAHLALQQWADKQKMPAPKPVKRAAKKKAVKKAPAKKAPAKKAPAKKAVKKVAKKAAKKKVAKKVAKKAPAKKAARKRVAKKK